VAQDLNQLKADDRLTNADRDSVETMALAAFSTHSTGARGSRRTSSGERDHFS